MYIASSNTGYWAALTAQKNQSGPVNGSAAAAKPAPAIEGKSEAAQQFSDYMKKSPAEQMQEAWLARHGISKEEFAAMPPEEQKALIARMEKEIKEELAQKARGSIANLLA